MPSFAAPPTYQEAILLDKLPEEENAGFTLEDGTQSDEDHDNIALRSKSSTAHQFIPQYVTYGGAIRNPPYQSI